MLLMIEYNELAIIYLIIAAQQQKQSLYIQAQQDKGCISKMYINEPYLKLSENKNLKPNATNKKPKTTTAKQINEYKFTTNIDINDEESKKKNSKGIKANDDKYNKGKTTVQAQNRQNKTKINNGNTSKQYKKANNNLEHDPIDRSKLNNTELSNESNDSRIDSRIGKFNKKKVLQLIGDQQQNLFNTIIDQQESEQDQQDNGKLRVDQLQFQNNLLKDLTKLIKKWQRRLDTVSRDLMQYDDVKQNQAEIKAFQQCVNLLDLEYDQAQAIHEGGRKIIQKKALQVDDYKLRLIKQNKQIKEQIAKITKQNASYDQQFKQIEKKKKLRHSVISKLEHEKKKLQTSRKMLLQCKQKSYVQKNEFVQLQSKQFQVQSQIRQIEEQQQKFQQENLRRQKYQQMLKVKQKILQARNNMEFQVRPHLQRKIQKMAQLRTSLKNIDQALNASVIKVQDQQIVIEALKQKSYHQQAYSEPANNIYQKYKDKYNQIYFGSNNQSETKNSENWNDYSTYLKYLVNKNRDFNKRVKTEIPQNTKNRSLHALGGHKNDLDSFYTTSQPRDNTNSNIYDRQILDLRGNNYDMGKKPTQQKFYGNSAKVNKNPENSKSQRLIQKKGSMGNTKLPRLVKIEGGPNEQKNLKNKVKDGIVSNSKNLPNNQQFSLQSIHSSDSNVSGQIIQVQFHKKH